MKLVCAHADAEDTGLACEHLLKKRSEEYYNSSEHFRFFTGHATQFVLLCPECAKSPTSSEAHWRTICDSCVQTLACGKRLGEIGEPEIRTRRSGLRLEHRNLFRFSKGITAASPLGNKVEGVWVFVTTECELMLLDPTKGSEGCFTLPVSVNLDRDQPLSLTVSRDGRFVGVANTFGRRAMVVDVEQQRVAMEFLRGDYRNDLCKFPLVFIEHEGKQLLVHATDWNRLDISDPNTGRLLTERGPTTYEELGKQPPHYLDYFQCGLFVSPESRWIASNGWVWHPVGVVAAWSVTRWLAENVWESEDGPSKKDLCWRSYYWDGPLCWINDRTLAVWALGENDILFISGVRLFDVETGQEIISFPGPVDGDLVFDRWLFSWKQGKPFSVWDVKDGTRLLEESDFTPLGYHRSSREFISVLPNEMLRLSRLVEDAEVRK